MTEDLVSYHSTTIIDAYPNSLPCIPCDILYSIKLKVHVFTSFKLNIRLDLEFVFHRLENIVGIEENAGNQHFLLFPQCVQKTFSSGGGGSSKVSLCGEGLNYQTENLLCSR